MLLDDERIEMPLVKPRVSVLLLCYNHERFVTDALESIRRQTLPDYELIIVDDYSRDGTVDVIKRYLSGHGMVATLLSHRTNRGVCASLNEALSASSGAYVALLAGDDRWLPQKLMTQALLLDRLPESVGVVYSDAYRIDEGGHRLPEMFVDFHDPEGRLAPRPPSGRIFRALLPGNFVPAIATLVRRACYQAVGCYDERLPYEDWDMWLRISRAYDFAFSPQPSAEYRELASSLSATMPSLAWYSSSLHILRKHLGIDQETDRLILSLIQNSATVKYCTGATSAREYWRDARAGRYTASTVLRVLAHILEPRALAGWRRALTDAQHRAPQR